MLPSDLVRRQAAQITEIPVSAIRSGNLSEAELALVCDAMDSLLELGPVLQLDAGDSVILSDLVTRVANANRKGPPVKLVAVDYLTRIDAGLGAANEHSSANLISRKLKEMATTHRATVIVGAQLSRKGDRPSNGDDPMSKYPRLSDLRDSGRIEEDADCVWLLHRDNELRLRGGGDVDAAALIVAKNRNGPVGIVELIFRPDITQFSE